MYRVTLAFLFLFALLCSALLFPSLPFPSLPFPSLPFPFLSFPFLSFPFLSFPSLSFPSLPSRLLSFPFFSFPFLSFPFLFFIFFSYFGFLSFSCIFCNGEHIPQNLSRKHFPVHNKSNFKNQMWVTIHNPLDSKIRSFITDLITVNRYKTTGFKYHILKWSNRYPYYSTL